MLSATGFGLLLAFLIVGFQSGRFPFPGGDVTNFLAAGARLRNGEVAYAGAWDGVGTAYVAPPLVVVFSIVGVLPSWVLAGLLVALDVIGLQYLTGPWRAFGWVALCPITAFQLASGNPNFAIMAAILAATRGRSEPLVWAALAKLGPALAIDFRDVRAFGLSALVAALITLPWLGLWPEWVRFLFAASVNPGWPILVPFAIRLPIAVALVATRRPQLQSLGGALAIPGFYVVTAWATTILAARILVTRPGRSREPVGKRTTGQASRSSSPA